MALTKTQLLSSDKVSEKLGSILSAGTNIGLSYNGTTKQYTVNYTGLSIPSGGQNGQVLTISNNALAWATPTPPPAKIPLEFTVSSVGTVPAPGGTSSSGVALTTYIANTQTPTAPLIGNYFTSTEGFGSGGAPMSYQFDFTTCNLYLAAGCRMRLTNAGGSNRQTVTITYSTGSPDVFVAASTDSSSPASLFLPTGNGRKVIRIRHESNTAGGTMGIGQFHYSTPTGFCVPSTLDKILTVTGDTTSLIKPGSAVIDQNGYSVGQVTNIEASNIFWLQTPITISAGTKLYVIP